MDLRLPLLADANLHIGIAEEAISESPPAYVTARSELEKAEAALEKLRADYLDLAANEQSLTAAMAKPLSARALRVLQLLPAPVAVSEGEAEFDPDEEIDPEDELLNPDQSEPESAAGV